MASVRMIHNLSGSMQVLAATLVPLLMGPVKCLRSGPRPLLAAGGHHNKQKSRRGGTRIQGVPPRRLTIQRALLEFRLLFNKSSEHGEAGVQLYAASITTIILSSESRGTTVGRLMPPRHLPTGCPAQKRPRAARRLPGIAIRPCPTSPIPDRRVAVNNTGSSPTEEPSPFVVSRQGLPSCGPQSGSSSPQSNPRSGGTSGKSLIA